MLALLASTLATYSRMLSLGFIALDDGAYVVDNQHLRETSLRKLAEWIFFSFDPDNWIPLTRFSLLLDFRLWELDGRLYHLENILMHAAASVLLYLFLRDATERRGPAAFCAAVFALHPLHVESVAWISERKDVLCALFWFAALRAWAGYVRQPSARRYLAALGLFALGAMAKPMIVTLPALLVLIDLWPLRRTFSVRLLVEKIPFAAVALGTMLATLAAQGSSDAVMSLNSYPLGLRLQNALATVVLYIGDTLWPARLWTPYAYPRSVPWWLTASACLMLLLLTTLAVRQVRSRPWLLTGWCWYVITLVPVIGIVQVGLQARADRYMYVPMVGLTFIVVWAMSEWLDHRPDLTRWSWVAGVVVSVALAGQSFAQTAHWESGETLFRHALTMDQGNYLAMNYLARTISDDRMPEALRLFERALEVRPENSVLHNNFALALCEAGRTEECLEEFRTAIELNPGLAGIHSQFGLELVKAGKTAEGVAELELAVRMKPGFAPPHADLGSVLVRLPGREAEGLRHMEIAVELNGRDALSRANLGLTYLRAGREAEAEEQFQVALTVNPDSPQAHRGMAELFTKRGMSLEAAIHREAARRAANPPR